MDSKKFAVLNPEYKTLLSQVEEIFKDVELKANLPLSKLQKIHDDIGALLGGGKIERNDLNNLLLNCTNDSVILLKLRDFVYLRNLKILEKVVKDDKYKDFVGRIKNLKGGANSNNIDKAFFKLIHPYLHYWDGLWRFVDFSKGRVKGVNVIDPEDIRQFNSYLDLF